MSKIFFVYLDWTLEDVSRCFYVGKGQLARVNRRERNDHWKNIAEKHGWRREVVLATKDEQYAFDEEKRLIREHKTFYRHVDYVWGANKTEGGEGVVGLKHTEEWLDKYAREESNSIFGKTGENWWLFGKPNPMLGRAHTNEANEKNRRAHLGKRHSPEALAKMSGENHSRAKLTREIVEQIRARHASTIHLPERHPERITCAMLAREYDTTVGNVGNILTHRIWK